MAVPHTYDDAIRIHDVAFQTWLSNLKVDYGTVSGTARNNVSILSIYSTPTRAWAALANFLVRTGWIAGIDDTARRTNAGNFTVFPLPLATIVRGEPTTDTELSGVPKQFRRKYLNPATGKYEVHRWPGHYRTDYTVTFWTDKRYTEAFIREWIMAQLGQLGAAEYETFIPVQHKAPWNTIPQSLKFTGSSDMSDLEGVETRYMRFEFMFSLRTWITRPIVETLDFIEGGGIDAEAYALGYGQYTDQLLPLDAADMSVDTANLFFFPFSREDTPTKWPKTGDAEVAWGEVAPRGAPVGAFTNTLKATVEDQADTVELAERLVLKDIDGRALVGFSFQYLSRGGSVEFAVKQRMVATDAVTNAHSLILPEAHTWKRVHRFTVVNKDTFIAQVEGVPPYPQQIVNLNDIDLRVIYPQTRIPPTTTTPGPSETKYEWFALANRPYLCILIVTATVGGPNIVTIEDDAVAPVYAQSQELDSAVNVGGVFLVQPKGSSIAARVPNGITLATAYLQVYDGAYRGCDI